MLDYALAKTDVLLGFLPAQVRGALVLPVAAILIFLLIAGLLRIAPTLDRLIGPLGAGLSVALGLLALVPEYLATALVRRSGRTPAWFLFLYGEVVDLLVGAGRKAFRTGLTPLVRQRRTRRWAATLGVLAIVGLGNVGACPDPQGACRTPVGTWWQHTTALLGSGHSGPANPVPPDRPTRKTVKG